MQLQPEDPIPVKEWLALVDRIAASQELRRSARLRGFLLYVAEQTLQNGVTGIHEQAIGEAVFGRPSSYDTGSDNIVRVNATELRKRLEHYFAGEGLSEQTIIEIPRGSYTPVFRRREAPHAPEVEASTVSLDTPVAPEKVAAVPLQRSRAGWMWPGIATVLLLVCLALVWQNRSLSRQVQPWKRDRALQRFWSEFFPSNSAEGVVTDVVLADTSLALAEDILGRNVELPDYLNYNYKRLAEEPDLSADRREALTLVLDRNNGSIGDFRVAQQILMLDPDPARLQLKFAREYMADAARHNNLVLIGSRKSNPWVGLFADRLNFDFEYDPARRRTFIVNRKPQAGEQATYPSSAASETPTSGYGVIAYLPGLGDKGRTLILEGIDSQSTAAAGEFVTSGDALAAFERTLPDGPFPFFEVLLRTSQLSGTPIHAEVIASRVYPR